MEKQPKAISLDTKDLKIIKKALRDRQKNTESLFVIPATYFVSLNDKTTSILYLQSAEKYKEEKNKTLNKTNLKQE